MKKFLVRISSKLSPLRNVSTMMSLPHTELGNPAGLKGLSRLQLYLGLCVILCVGTILAMIQFVTYYDTTIMSPSASVQATLENGLVYSGGGVIKDEHDNKNYATVVLGNNLRVLVISVPGTQVSAVGIDVAAGSLEDPKDIQGLAHLLEHMVFMGNKDFLEENGFEQFLGEYNGHSNAYTSQENTNYYYKVSSNMLEESLERVASQLRSPLLRNSSMSRELHAIESEFVKDSLEDTRRTWRLFKHLSEACHPFHRLSPGNLETLQKVETLKRLRTFHQTHYIAEKMKLVIYGKETPQMLLEMAKKYFSAFSSKSVLAERQACEAYPKKSLGKWVEYTPLRDGHTLDILFPISDRSRCGISVVSKILGIKHSFSAATALKKQGWAISLTSSVYASTSQFSVLRINIKLTSLGASNVWKVTKILFDYIKTLQTEDSDILKHQLDKIYSDSIQSFKTQNQVQPHHFVKQLAYRMNVVLHPAYYLGAPLYSVTSNCVQQTFSILTPQNSLILFGSSKDNNKVYQIEPWYKITYHAENITLKQIAYLSYPKYIVSLSPPKVSRNMLQQMMLYRRDDDQAVWPVQIHKDDGLTLWWQQDYLFHVPRVDLIAWVFQTNEYANAQETAHAVILVTMIQDQLSDIMFEFGVTVNVHYQSSSGFIVQMHGYSHDFLKTVSQVFAVISDLDMMQVDRFNWVVKYEAGRKLMSTKFAEAYKHPLFNSRVVLEEHIYPLNEVQEEIEKATLKSVTKFYANLKSDVGVRCVVYGNLIKSMAEQYVQAILPLVRDSNSKLIDPPFHPTIQYPAGTYLTKTSYPNPNEKASVADIAFIFGPTPWNGATLHSSEPLYTQALLARITATILQEPLFTELRSKQQLGYSVFSKYVPHFGIDYIHLCVQGTEHSSVVMANAIFEFLKDFRYVLKRFDINHLNSIISSVKQSILTRPDNPLDKILLLVNELFSPDPQYNRQDLYLLALESLNTEKLLDFYDTYILGDSSRRFILLSDSRLDKTSAELTIPHIRLDSNEINGGFSDEVLQPFLYWRFTHLGISL